jgi:hypothetical protein
MSPTRRIASSPNIRIRWCIVIVRLRVRVRVRARVRIRVRVRVRVLRVRVLRPIFLDLIVLSFLFLPACPCLW